MTNAFGADLQRAPDRIRTIGLARMRRQMKPRVFRITIRIAEIPRRPAQFISSDAERDSAIAHMIGRQTRHLHHVIGAELPDGIEVPPHLHTVACARLFLRIADRPPHRMKIETPPQDHARRQRNLRVTYPLARQRFDHAPRDQGIVLRPPQALRDELETVQKTVEIRKPPHAIDILFGKGWVEKHHGLPVDRAFEMEVKLCQSHIIEVPMNAAEMEAIVGGYHGDAFSVLGPHPINIEKGKTAWEIRAFLPQAKSASVVIKGTTIPMEKRHREGFFVAELKREPGAYKFHIDDYHGGEAMLDDPYRFGIVITDFDLHLHSEGTLYEAWKSFGAHLARLDDTDGVRFAVWAPNAEFVSVAGDFNDWDTRRHPMRLRTAGVWEIFIPGAKEGQSYKYLVRSKFLGHQQLKSDPVAFRSEHPPKSASIVCSIDGYEWQDGEWMAERAESNVLRQPVSIYEVHLESWMHGPGGEVLTYGQLAVRLVEYVKRMGYTHIELLPIQEYPFSGSWGYQVIGYFAPTSRFGTPEEFMLFVDTCHREGVGVIIDWVPAHFPKDAHGLAFFDGTALYEHSDPRQGDSEWGTLIFNFGRNEVREFLIASALFWLKKYHIDGLRVDAVASMLYLDFARKQGEWIPNRYGGRENLEAIEFIKRFNELAHTVPGAMTIAEESTSFSGVTRPVYANGLGFTMKWNMGWMHDMLNYFAVDPVYRKFYHNNITFSMLYAFSENFVLPISHDEVVYGKRSLLSKMPGDEWQKFANARAFFAYMYAHPGKKLQFMGCDIGDYLEWNHNTSVPWEILQFPMHAAFQSFVKEINRLYAEEPALYEVDFEYAGFEWIDIADVEKSVISFIRYASNRSEYIVFACNFTPVPRFGYEIGVPEAGFYREILNTDAAQFGGSNLGNCGGVTAKEKERHHRPFNISITLPPLAVVAFKNERVPRVG